MPAENIKDVTFGDNRFGLYRMEARAGGKVLARLLAQLQRMATGKDAATETEDDGTPPPSPEKLIQLLYLNLNEQDTDFVQEKALGTVTVYKTIGAAEQPISIYKNGSVLPEFREDTALIMALTSQALFANMSPFFTKAALELVFTGQYSQAVSSR